MFLESLFQQETQMVKKFLIKSLSIILINFSFPFIAQAQQPEILVYQTDFGLKDGAVSTLHGTAMAVDTNLKIFDLTHEIPAFNIWEASYRLMQTINFWPKGTVFVSIIDPGVGAERNSVVLKTNSGHFIVTPNNGTLTLAAERFGVSEVREIDENKNRRDTSETRTSHASDTDVFSFVAARLASNQISLDDIGPKLSAADIVSFDYQRPEHNGDAIIGNIPSLDPQYGNIWTNIPGSLLLEIGYEYGDVFDVVIKNDNAVIYEEHIPYAATFSDVPNGRPLIYLNAIANVSLALNMDNFSATHNVFSGPKWTIEIKKHKSYRF